MSERVLSVAASNEYHLDSLTHRKSVLHLFCTSLNTPDTFFFYIPTSMLSVETLYFQQLAIWDVMHLFST